MGRWPADRRSGAGGRLRGLAVDGKRAPLTGLIDRFEIARMQKHFLGP
ncbi:hypothetical protein AB0I98_32270 [Streptomyces sp. NPDC050211]